ncbi:hypothetical protein FDH02_gp43 [Pseudomonas phage VSW-3]|uniref:Uncharacterized protein n=1 Tax=Pseudomonas phage VSW-3 TaxID=1852562 RepID=A0A173GDI9_9CAUD|nr:hypothetical protein FDH02_gp43 [Pseudomonas phage VSW-3]ANH51119.1 hypothetical protein VSW3_44 [Pseudomonas phage VSW-3]
MSRKPKLEDLKPGQRIRVRSAGYHNVKSGALVRIMNISKFDGDLLVKGPCKFPFAVNVNGSREMIDEQYVEFADVLHIAKEK